MTLIADVSLKLQLPKNVVKKISKKLGFRGPFHKQQPNGPKTVEI